MKPTDESDSALPEAPGDASACQAPSPGRVLYDWPEGAVEEHLRLPSRIDDDAEPCDIAVIGAGLLGTALAWRLSQFQLHVLLIDARHAVGEGAARTCPGILRTGYDARPGSDAAQVLAAGRERWPGLARDLKIPTRRPGALVLAPPGERSALDELLQNARMNGVEDARLVTREEALEIEPALAPRGGEALFSPREGLVDPFTAAVAFAETAVRNGVDLVLGLKIVRVADLDKPVKVLVSQDGRRIPARAVINCAGLGARPLADVCGGEAFIAAARRRQFLLLDPCGPPPVRRILSPLAAEAPSLHPTVCDRLLVGPTLEDARPGDPDLDATSGRVLRDLRRRADALSPAASDLPALRAFAGPCAHTPQEPVHLRFDDGARGIVCAAGHVAQEPAAAPELVERIVEGLVAHLGLALDPRPGARTGRDAAQWPVWWRKPLEATGQDAPVEVDHARVVCQCLSVSVGELRRALDSPLKPRTLDAVKRMTRVLTGPCQGGECLLQLAELMSEHTGAALERITFRGPGTELTARAGEEKSRP